MPLQLTDLEVREAAPSDAEAVATFMLAAWHEAGPDSPGFTGATPELMAEIATPEAIRARIRHEGRRVFLARSREGTVGFAGTRPLDARIVELAGIIVGRAAAGQGICTRLVEQALAAASRDGFARMVVRTERTNDPAIVFYRARGFEPAADCIERVGDLEVPVLELARQVPQRANTGIRPFRPQDEPALRRVMEASLEFDAFPGFTAWDMDMEAVSIVGAPDGVAVAVEDGLVCGYVSPRHDDLTVHPEFRRRGHGRRLFAAGLDLAAKAGWEEIRLCVPSSGAARPFARAMGLTYRSSMWRLSLAPETAVPEPALPADVIARPLGEWLPLQRYVDLLNATFAEHPGPVSWTLGQVLHAHGRPEFDPSAILLVSPADRPEDPVAFVRTALGPPEDNDPAPVGEIGLVGVLPQWRGRGLGRELLRWGVAQLRSRGAGCIKLSVEAENELALGLYRRTGFEPVVEWPHWVCPVTAHPDDRAG
ncbi:MAG: GNAT family N-acetyltransferase [Candidatus Limnocylindrales bacterium]|jgi:mycothiol synthase